MKVSIGGDIVPIIGDLTFVNSGDEIQSGNGVFSSLAEQFRKLDHFLLQCDVGVLQNLVR